MKQLNSVAGIFGPFASIETLQDRYRCDGADFQFSVIGDATIEDYVAPPAPPVVVPVPALNPVLGVSVALSAPELLPPPQATSKEVAVATKSSSECCFTDLVFCMEMTGEVHPVAGLPAPVALGGQQGASAGMRVVIYFRP